MPPMWAVEQVDWLETLATHFGVEVQAAGRETAVLEQHEHDLRGQVNVGRELIGIPAQQQVAEVGIDGAKEALHRGIFELVLHCVAGECGVVRFDVHLHVLFQAVTAQEVQARSHVEVVLMLRRLFRLLARNRTGP